VRGRGRLVVTAGRKDLERSLGEMLGASSAPKDPGMIQLSSSPASPSAALVREGYKQEPCGG
jgi:hypothetical protein